jgi:glycosyltransferase involved in cell wall biosynthesis
MAPQLLTFPLSEQDSRAEKLQRELEHLGIAPLHIVSPSRLLAGELERCPVFRNWTARHIPNGVNPALFNTGRKSDGGFRRSLQLTPGATVILVVNRNYRVVDKGFPMIREALGGLRSFDGLEVVLVGEGAEWAASQLPEGLRVIPVGFVFDRTRMAGLYEAADIFLFASRYENFPCVTLEAMSAGCCVVATPTPGVVEQIVDGVSGSLAGSVSGAALGVSLQKVLDGTTDERRRFGLEARKEVEQSFSEEKMVEQHLEFYREIMAGYSTKNKGAA